VKVLLPHVGEGGAPRIRVAMQIVLATVTDAILQKRPGPLQAGSSKNGSGAKQRHMRLSWLRNGRFLGGRRGRRERIRPEDRSIETEEEIRLRLRAVVPLS